MKVSYCCRLHYINDLKTSGRIIGYFEVVLGMNLIIIDATNVEHLILAGKVKAHLSNVIQNK